MTEQTHFNYLTKLLVNLFSVNSRQIRNCYIAIKNSGISLYAIVLTPILRENCGVSFTIGLNSFLRIQISKTHLNISSTEVKLFLFFGQLKLQYYFLYNTS